MLMPGTTAVLQADGSSAKKAAKKAKSTGAKPCMWVPRRILRGLHA